MNRIWLILILAILPGLGFAQPVAVRTGEHAGFSRVVLTIPQGTEWQLGRNAQGYVIKLSTEAGFDLGRFFDLIPRTRITEATQNAATGELLLAVSCACNATAFLFRPNVLVVDVRDGAPSALSAFERPLGPSDLTDDSSVYAVSANRLLPIIVPDRNGSVSDPATEQVSPDPNIATPMRVAGPRNDRVQDLSALEDEILVGLGQGLTAGLLTGEQQFDPVSDDGGADFFAAQALPGITLRGAADPAAFADAAGPDVTQSGDPCLPAAYFDVPDWGDDRPFFDQINPIRAGLIGEFDRVNEEAATDLARLFVFFGFGREAQNTLALVPSRSQDKEFLGAMAAIVDGDPVEAGRFAGQISCPSAVALWALLALPDGPLDATVNRSAVLSAFKSLPEGLQNTLGPRLSDRFVGIGDQEAALQVLAPARDSPEPSAEVVIADAALMSALGDTDRALEAVTQVVRQDARATPEAVITFFEKGIADGLAFTDTDFGIADVMRFELAGSPLAVDLTLSQIAAYLHVDRFDEAAGLLASERDKLDISTFAALEESILLQATDRMGDAAFLEFIWSDALSIGSTSAQTAVAERLLGLGFPAQAKEILEKEMFIGAPATQDYLMADAALALGEVDRALDLMAGESSARAALLRRRAQEMRRDQAAFGIGLDAAAALAGNAVGQDVPSSPLLPDTPRPLADSRALLDQSVAARAMLEGLLQQYATPEDF